MASNHTQEDGRNGSPQIVEATQTSITVLRYLKKEGPSSLSEIAEALGNSKSTIYRHVTTLERAGYIVNTSEGYRISLLFLDYGIQTQQTHPFYVAAKEKIDQLAEEVSGKIWGMTEENGLGAFIYHQQETNAFRTYTRVGYRGHLHAFAAGKAVLAYLPDERTEEIIQRHGLPAYSEQTIVDKEDLYEEIERIRDRGVAFNRKESIKGVNAVAAPVLYGPNEPLGAISIAGAAQRMQGAYFEEEIPDRLLGITNEIEVQLEYDQEVFREDRTTHGPPDYA